MTQVNKINQVNVIFSAVSLAALFFIIFFSPTTCDGGIGVLGCGLTLRLLLSALIYLNVVAQIIFSLWRLYHTKATKEKDLVMGRLLHYLLLILILTLAWLWFAGGLVFSAPTIIDVN